MSHWVGDTTQPSHPLWSPSPPAFNLSRHQGLFQRGISSHQVPKYRSFNFRISPSNEYSALISFRVDWCELFAVQGTLKSLLQHHSSKASILWRSAFFTVQLAHPYMTTGKTIALARWTFVGQVMSLFFNMLSRLVITFLPRSKRLLISWLQSPSAVILDSPQIKSATVSTVGLIAHLCYNLTDYSPLGFSVHGILQARILEWVNCFLLQGLFLTQESNPGFMHCRQIFTVSATR